MSTATGRDGYDAAKLFVERTAKSLETDARLFAYDALLTTGYGFDMAGHYWQIYTAMMPFLARRRGYRVLELGSGFGRNAPFLSMFDCSDYVGVEREVQRLAWARERHGSRRIKFEAGDATTYRGGQFDVVVSCTVLQHLVLPEKLALIDTCKAALAPGGVVLLWEGRIFDASRDEVEAAYRNPHMVPMTLADAQGRFAPLRLRKVWDCLYAAELKE